jgi:glycosyltransferase involved in cell wall biosynthesis
MPLRILLTCEDYFPHVGGAEVCVHNLKKQYERMGHAVTLYTNATQETGEAGVVRVAWRFTPRGFLRNVAALWRLIGHHNIVHSQYSFRLACLCSVIATVRRKPMVLTQQGRGIVPEQHPNRFSALLAAFCRRISITRADLLTATSDEIADLTAAYVPRGRISVISNGYDADLFRPDPSLALPPEYHRVPLGRTYILSVRRLVPKNGIHIFIQALSLVREQRDDFHYFVIGEGRVESFIRRLIVELQLQNHVTLLGKRSNGELPAYYHHTDLVVIPSSAEARSIACIEAMAMGKPIIASRVGGLIELLGRGNEYGTLVPIYESEFCTYDPPERLSRERLQPLADAVLSFLADPEPFREKASRASAHVREHCSWERIAGEYFALYERLLMT